VFSNVFGSLVGTSPSEEVSLGVPVPRGPTAPLGKRGQIVDLVTVRSLVNQAGVESASTSSRVNTTDT